MIDQNPTHSNKTKNIADQNLGAFLDYGVGHVAYVRPIKEENAFGYGIFAANGAPIGVVADSASAYSFLMEHNLVPVVLH